MAEENNATTEAMTFRKKPVEIRAMKWNGENLDSIESFAKGNASMENGELVIKTLEDGKEGQAIHAASVGDYIIEGVQGEFYFCKPDIFEQTYDAVPENTKNIKKEFMDGLKEEMKLLDSEENQGIKIEFSELFKDNLEKFNEDEQKEINSFVMKHGNGNIEKGVEELEKTLKTEIAIENGALWEYDSNNRKILKNPEPYTQEDKENAKKNFEKANENDPIKQPIRIKDREGREYTLNIVQREKTPKKPAYKELHIVLDETGETLAQLPYANDFFDKPTKKELQDTVLKEFNDHKDEMIDNYRNYQEKKHLENKKKEHEILTAEKEFTEDREKRINDAFGKNPTETDRNKKAEATTSKNGKESLELGKTYLATFSWTDKNGEKQEIKACYEIGMNKKEKEAIIFKNNKAFPYSDSSLAPGDENISANMKALKISQFPKEILSSPKLLEVWNKRLETLGLEKFPEGTKDFKVETKDITRELEKNEKKENKESKEIVTADKKIEDEQPVISKIPEKLKQFYEAKENPLTPETYTKKLFDVTKELFKLENAERNIDEKSREYFKKIESAYSKTDGSDMELEKAFNKFISNPNNEKILDIMGIMLEKHETMNQPYQRQLPEEVRYDMNRELEAIKANKHPLQMPGIPPMIFNPEENNIYRGNAQIALATNNAMHGMNEKAYVTMSQANQSGAEALKNYKVTSTLVAHGQDANGNYVYQLMVPCKALKARNAEKKLAKIEKENRKINYDMIKAANKFYKKHGFLPQYDIELRNAQQPSLAKASEINIPQQKVENTQDRITNDLNKYMACMLTQTEFKPSVDYTKEPHKTELFDFQQSHPETMMILANKAYYNIASQTIKTNENVQTRTNDNTQNRTSTNEPKLENVKTNTNGKGRGRH